MMPCITFVVKFPEKLPVKCYSCNFMLIFLPTCFCGHRKIVIEKYFSSYMQGTLPLEKPTVR